MNTETPRPLAILEYAQAWAAIMDWLYAHRSEFNEREFDELISDLHRSSESPSPNSQLKDQTLVLGRLISVLETCPLTELEPGGNCVSFVDHIRELRTRFDLPLHAAHRLGLIVRASMHLPR